MSRGPSPMVRAMSLVGRRTSTANEAVLLAGAGSAVSETTLTVLTSEPLAEIRNHTAKSRDCPAARVPALQTTGLAPLQPAGNCVVPASPAGGVNVTTVLVAEDGPLLWMVAVKRTVSPTTRCTGGAESVTPRSEES